MSEEEDLAVLIYKSSKTAKARAAMAAAAKEKGRMNESSAGRRTSTRKRSQDDEASIDRPAKNRAVRKREIFENNQKAEEHSDIERYALLTDARNWLRKEECALGMGQSSSARNAGVKDALIMLSKEEFAKGMVPRRNNAAVKGAPTTFKKEVCASGMGQRPNYVAVKDAQI